MSILPASSANSSCLYVAYFENATQMLILLEGTREQVISADSYVLNWMEYLSSSKIVSCQTTPKWQFCSSHTLAKAVQYSWSAICVFTLQMKFWFFWNQCDFCHRLPWSQPVSLCSCNSFTNFMATSKCENQCENEEEGESQGGIGQDQFWALFSSPHYWCVVSDLFRAHPYLAPEEVLWGSQPATLEAERHSYSHSVQGFHCKICKICYFIESGARSPINVSVTVFLS